MRVIGRAEHADSVSRRADVSGADEGVVPTSTRERLCPTRSVGTISAIVGDPQAALGCASSLIDATERRHRPALVLKTNAAESR